jgi:hypothetical protein
MMGAVLYICGALTFGTGFIIGFISCWCTSIRPKRDE